MSIEAIVVAVHGMGDTKENFHLELEKNLSRQLGDDWPKVHFTKVYYQGILQDNQNIAFSNMKNADIDWVKARKFMLYGFSDAAGLERRSHIKNSPYHQAQKIIKNTLIDAYHFVGSAKPVIIIAQSLGGQVMSNYIWDAQSVNARQGIWRHDDPIGDPELEDFIRLKSMKYFYTTGCNIPIFVAGFPRRSIKAIDPNKSGWAFKWKNFYDEDDVLGWPLKPLSASYEQAIWEDRTVQAGGSLWGNISQSWNPLSHNRYWHDNEVIQPLASDLRQQLN